MSDHSDPLRITHDDLAKLDERNAAVAPLTDASEVDSSTGEKRYGNIRDTVDVDRDKLVGRGSILLKSWFYLGFAGMFGALAGWGIIEPFYDDAPSGFWSWPDSLIIPMVVALCCLGCAIAESVVERSWRKAALRGLLALALGIPLGFVFSFAANVAYSILLGVASITGPITPGSPAWWACRSLAWVFFGVSAGLVYGVVGMSVRKLLYGVLGGMLGAGIGGVLFDPIALYMDTGDLSRAVGFAVFGVATGAAMGLVESALKDRWLQVTSGPLAGKQFILYKPLTTIGRSQLCDVYLFKDPSIQDMHATLERRGPGIWLTPRGPVYMHNQPTRPRMLQNRDLIQIGRYTFRYQERRAR
jgi:hypothetical protein